MSNTTTVISTDTTSSAVTSGNPEDTPGTDTAEPELILGKFKTPEDLANAYTELEKKLSAPRETPADAAAPSEGQAPPVDAEQVLEDAGVSEGTLDTLFAQYEADGNVSEDSYKLLESKGIPRKMVDAYIAGQEAIAGQFTNAVHSFAGGEAQFTALQTWAAENMTPEAIESINELLSSGDTTRAEIAVRTIQSAQGSRVGVPPARVISGDASSSGSTGYGSMEEYVRDTSNPKYWSDPSFRDAVDAKLKKGFK